MEQKNKNIFGLSDKEIECDIRVATEEEEFEKRLKSDRYCNWKNSYYGRFIYTQCDKKLSDTNIEFTFVKSFFKVCPFCGKPINFI